MIWNDLTVHSFHSGYTAMLYHEAGDIYLVSHALRYKDMRSTRKYVIMDLVRTREIIDHCFH